MMYKEEQVLFPVSYLMLMVKRLLKSSFLCVSNLICSVCNLTDETARYKAKSSLTVWLQLILLTAFNTHTSGLVHSVMFCDQNTPGLVGEKLIE